MSHKIHDAVDQVQEETFLENSKENQIIPSEYGCEILLEKIKIAQAKDVSFPNDAKLIWYTVGKEQYIDLVRGSMVRIFDMYYDNYGASAVQKIDFGYGKVDPRSWGYKKPEGRRRR